MHMQPSASSQLTVFKDGFVSRGGGSLMGKRSLELPGANWECLRGLSGERRGAESSNYWLSKL